VPRPKKQVLKARKDGRYCCKYKGIQFMGNSSDEALAARDEYKRREAEGQRIGQHVTLGAYAAEWLPVHKAGVKQTTYNGYVSILEAVIAPAAAVPLDQLSTDDIARLYSRLNGKSASYIHKAKNLLTAILDSATDAGYMRKNPCRAQSVKPPKGTKGTHRAITDEEKRLILSTPHRMQLAALFMLFCGLRRGEALAVEASDISGDMLTVSRAVAFVGNRPVVSTPKTEAGIRSVPVPPILRPFLSDLKGFAVTSANGSIMSETAFQRGWKSFLHALSIAAGHPVSIRAHDLRHTYCTMLRDAGVDIHQAIIWMGHADEKMILRIYDHPGRTREEEAKTRLNFAFGMQNGMQNQDGPAEILYL
jgi:integrase